VQEETTCWVNCTHHCVPTTVGEMSRADHPRAAAIWMGSPVSGVDSDRNGGSQMVSATAVPSSLCEEKECWTTLTMKTREVRMDGPDGTGDSSECV
jgi:hypothetical protein